MGVRMTDEEAWTFLERGHTAILTTLRRDGWPVSLPLWYVVTGEVIHVATPTRSKKITRITNDDRACLLVESGDEWASLAAVELPVRALVLPPDAEAELALAAFDHKYAPFRPARAAMPESAVSRYASQTVIRLEPAGPFLTWDNAKLSRKR